MYNWKQLCANECAYEGLHSELRNCGGKYILEGVILPDTCSGKETDIEFRYYSENHISLHYSDYPTEYSGSDDAIAAWMYTGVVEFRSFSELAEFLSRFAGDSAEELSDEPDDTGEDVPERPEMRYDRTAINVPGTDNRYCIVDKDRLIADLGKDIFGQDENIEKIAHLVCNHIGTKRKTRPLSVFLYGPTGIGKSAVVESLVKNINKQLGRRKAFAYRPVDCTQYQEHHDISRLIGSPPGYVGFDEPGVFEILEENKNTVFVFEEIEKAAANISESIMQAMETGRQETNGKTLKNGKQYYDLSSSIIFFTSNIEVEEKRPSLGFATIDEDMDVQAGGHEEHGIRDGNIARMIGRETKEAKEKLAATGRFRKEVIGRMDAIIRFNALTDSSMVDIAAKCISDVAANEHLLYITELDDSVLQDFINETADEVGQFGARALKSEARYYFSDVFRDFSYTHRDYAHIRVSGRLNDLRIKEDNQS